MLAISSMALFASETRLTGLQADGWMVEQDDSLIWMNPARVAEAGKCAWIDMNSSITSGGVTMPVGSSTIGVFANRPYSGYVDYYGYTPQEKVNIFIANNVDESLKIGALLQYADYSVDGNYSVFETTSSDFEDTNNITIKNKIRNESSDIKLTFGTKTDNLDIIMSVGKPIINNEDKTSFSNGILEEYETLKTKDNLSYRGAVRYNFGGVLGYMSYSLDDISNESRYQYNEDLDTSDILNGSFNETDDENYLTDTISKITTATIGASMNLKKSDKSLIVCGLKATYTEEIGNIKENEKKLGLEGVFYKGDQSYKTVSIPIVLGYETKFSKVVTMRCGVKQNLFTNIEMKVVDNYYYWDSETSTYKIETIADYTITTMRIFGTSVVSLGMG